MGLDGVELVMAFEERFGVTLTDAEAATCRTPGQVIDLLTGKLHTADAGVCVQQRAFHLLRRAVMERFTLERHAVRLETDLRTLAPPAPDHRQLWQELRLAVDARSWPALDRPPWMNALLWIVPLASIAATGQAIGWLGASGVGFAVAVMARRATNRFRNRIPAGHACLRQLVPYAATSNRVTWTRDQVASVVREIVIEQLGLPPAQYREDADFVRDLGLH